MKNFKTKAKGALIVVSCTIIYVLFLHLNYYNQVKVTWKNLFGTNEKESNIIHLALVSCAKVNYQAAREVEKPLDQSLTMIKSVVLFSTSLIHFHIFTENDMKFIFKSELNSWPNYIKKRVNYTIYDIDETYSMYFSPYVKDEWKKWYKPCGSFRLLLPMVLQNTADAVIYCDSDIIFIKPVEDLWSELQRFKKSQVIAISPTTGHSLGGSDDNENMISHSSGLFQINSGVLLFNIKHMLDTNWNLYPKEDNPKRKMKYGIDFLLEYYFAYKDRSEHDQKLLNIIFHYNYDLIRQLPCKWNFKNNFCSNDDNTCPDAEVDGAAVVHGISSTFFGDVNPTFRALYEAFLEYELEDEDPTKILNRYLMFLHENAMNTYCWKKSHIITKSLAESIERISAKK